MKVNELIETLKIYNKDSEVLIMDYAEFNGEDQENILPINTINEIEPIVTLKSNTIILLTSKVKEFS